MPDHDRGELNDPRAAEPQAGALSDALADRMRAAEDEAEAYLGQAKKRADSLIATIAAGVEREVAAVRREAEAGFRERRQQAESDAGHRVDEARRVAEGMVAERQRQIAALSDRITRRAAALTAGMDDAERIRAQFDGFLRALSATADRIAAAPGLGGGSDQLQEPGESPKTDAIAA